MPKVSVIMSVYSEWIDWIKQSIDSILNQTFRDFEFIIVNDNPERKENALLLEEYAKKDSRIRCIINEENIGLTKSLNRCLKVATGQYIARMDADDISMPNRLEEQVKFLDLNRDIVACGSDAIATNKDGEVRGKIVTYHTKEEIKVSMLFQSPIIHPAAMFRRVIGGSEVLYDEYYSCAQDYALWASLFDYPMANLPQVLLHYRLSDVNITSKKRDKQLAYSKEIQDSVYSKLDLTLSDKIRENIFFLIYNNNDHSDINNNMLTSNCYDVVSNLSKKLPNKAVDTLRSHLVTCYIRYTLHQKDGNVLLNYIKFCKAISFPISRKMILLAKLFIANKKGK